MKQKYSIVQLSENNKPKTEIYTSKECVTLGRALTNDLRVQQNGIENKHLEMNLKNKTLLAYGSDVKINDFPVLINTITSFNFSDKISIKDTHFSVQLNEMNDDGIDDKSTLSNLVDTPFFSPSPLKFNPSPQKPRRSVEKHSSVFTPSYDQSTTTSDYNLYLQPPVRNVKQTSSDFLDVSQPKLNHEESFLTQTEDGLSSEIKTDLKNEFGVLESHVEKVGDEFLEKKGINLENEFGVLESPVEKVVDECLEKKKEIQLENISVPLKTEILDSNLNLKKEKKICEVPGIFSKTEELNILNNAINEENSDGIVTFKKETVTEIMNNGTKEVTKEIVEEVIETETKTFFGLEEAIDREQKRVDEEIKSNVEKITEGSVDIPVSPKMVKHPNIDLHAAVLEKNILKNAKDVLEEEVRDKIEVETNVNDGESLEFDKELQKHSSIEILEDECFESTNLVTKRLSDGDEKIPDLRIKRIKKEESIETLDNNNAEISNNIISEPIIEEIPERDNLEEVEEELEYKEVPKLTVEVFKEKEDAVKEESNEIKEEKDVEKEESNEIKEEQDVEKEKSNESKEDKAVEKEGRKRKRERKSKEKKSEEEVIKKKGKRGRKPKNQNREENFDEKKTEEEVINNKGKRGRKPKNQSKEEEIIKEKGKRGRKPKGEKKTESLEDMKIEKEDKLIENKTSDSKENSEKRDISDEKPISPKKRGRPSHSKDSSVEKNKEHKKHDKDKLKEAEEERRNKNRKKLKENKSSSKNTNEVKEKETEQRKSSKNNFKKTSPKSNESPREKRKEKHKKFREEETSKSKESSTEPSPLIRKPRRASFKGSSEKNEDIKKSEVHKKNLKKHEESNKKQEKEIKSENSSKIKKKRRSASISSAPLISSKKSKK